MDQEEEDEDKNNMSNSKYSSPSYNYGTPSSSSQTAQAINFMDLPPRNASDDIINNEWPPNSEREHMFDKVVTPSDVGKLNRLVIPKQHAEKYFPLDSTTNEKGLLLNFLDRTGKPWRFRYSYWNSSQSYVMTKGWSRFVKDKKLDAGDVVSFERNVRDSNLLYIDWRRRLPPPPPHNMWGAGGGRFYSLQRPPSMAMPLRHHEHYNQYSIHHPYYHHQYQYHHHQMNPYQLLQHQPQYYHHNEISPGMVIDSVPIVQHPHHHHHHQNYHGKNMMSTTSSSTNKRLRLFGVNMECSSPMQEDDEQPAEQCQILSSTVAALSPHHHHHNLLPASSSSLSQPLEFRLPNYTAPLPASAEQLLSKKGKSTSLSFYLDP